VSCLIHRWRYSDTFSPYELPYEEMLYWHSYCSKFGVGTSWSLDKSLPLMKEQKIRLATKICRKCSKKMVARVGFGLYCIPLRQYVNGWVEIEPTKQERRDIRIEILIGK
jgi:hypothetical protein